MHVDDFNDPEIQQLYTQPLGGSAARHYAPRRLGLACHYAVADWVTQLLGVHTSDIWIISYRQGDLPDSISGYEGTLKPRQITPMRQIDRRDEIQGTLLKGINQEYSGLVKKIKVEGSAFAH